jgi:hypothetical protein
VRARVGFSATYSNPDLLGSRTAVAWVRGDGPRDRFEVVDGPPELPLDEAVAAYRARRHQVLFATSDAARHNVGMPPAH